MNHLLVRSCYTLLAGTMKPERIAALAKENHQKYAVLSDHNSMLGMQAFFRACKKEGIQAVAGMSVEVQIETAIHPLLLLAKNSEGLQSLYALASRISEKNNAPLSLAQIKEHQSGTVLIAGAADYVLESFAHEKDDEACVSFFQKLTEVHEQVYFGVSLQESSRWKESAKYLCSTAEAIGMEQAAVSVVEYEKEEDESLLQLMQAIAKQTTVNDLSLQRRGRFYRSKEQMEELYDAALLENTDRLLESFEPYDLPKASLPVFINKSGAESDIYLKSLCTAGLKKRLQDIPNPDVALYKNRLDYELSVITSMGFADYFLIVWDFIREARSRGMYVGPGRGSAAGSLVAYSLGISHVDPVANGLLFERFLNPDRISMPDIDTDFPDNRRDEIIRYMQEKYGKGHAAHIVTFATFKSKSALRDSARALGMPKEAPEKLCRMIVTKNGISETLQQAYDNHPEFARTVESSSSLKKLYETAKRLEGYPRHYSTHAGGIVLCRDLIEKHAPLLYMQGEDLPAVQFEMDYLEDLGLIKFDFLALKNLTIIDDVVQMARSAGHPVPDMLKIPLDDPKVFRLLGSAQTLGVFQLESDGIRDLLLRYKPKKFAEIADVIALYRPGPMKSIQSYLQARANPASIQSIHPLLDSLLKETGGIFLYQEQIMEAARIIGGFTLSQADTLRKAMSKKKKDVMESYARQFEEGAAEKGIPLEKAREIFSLMEQFAQYGYNKSHSYAYAMIVYQMAWLKVNEPLSFYICSLQSTLGASAKTAAFLSEMRAQNIPILPVSINRSKEFYLSENNAVRLPFAVIKGLGKQAAQKIVQEREQRGAYKDPALAIMRLLHAGLDKTQLKLLVKAGAFDELQVNRETLLDEFERILGMESILSWDEKGGCFITPGMSGVVLEPSAPREMERLYAEKELFGFYLSLHPCQILRNRDRRIAPICNVLPVLGNAAVCGIITRVKEHTTKNGQKMAFAAIEDDTGTIDCSIMPREYERYQNDLKEGVLLSVYGRKDRPASLLPSSLQFYSAADVLAQSRMQRQNSYAGKGQNRMR